MSNSKAEATYHGSDAETVDLRGDNVVVQRMYAITQVVARKLYDDKDALGRLALFLVADHIERGNLTPVDGESRAAFSFGQLVHAADCTVPTFGSPECTVDCAIVPCSEGDATVVMMQIEFKIEGSTDE